jgi:hypothetical protein
METVENIDPRQVAAELDDLVEQAYQIVARTLEPGRGLDPLFAINRLAGLFDGGQGRRARTLANKLLRPEKPSPS